MQNFLTFTIFQDFWNVLEKLGMKPGFSPCAKNFFAVNSVDFVFVTAYIS